MWEKSDVYTLMGFPGGSVVESACQHRRCGFDNWVGKIPWRRKQQPTPRFLPGKSHGQRSLAGYKSMGSQELDTTEQLNQPSNPRAIPSNSVHGGLTNFLRVKSNFLVQATCNLPVTVICRQLGPRVFCRSKNPVTLLNLCAALCSLSYEVPHSQLVL